MKTNISTVAIHIFYSAEYPNGYTSAKTSREACKIAVEIMHRTGSPVSTFGGTKDWQGKYSNWIIRIDEPFREQKSGGYVINSVLG